MYGSGAPYINTIEFHAKLQVTAGMVVEIFIYYRGVYFYKYNRINIIMKLHVRA